MFIILSLKLKIKNLTFISIKVEFENEKGEKQEREFIDLPSRVFQHEYDHMESLILQDLSSPLKLHKNHQKTQ